MARGFLLGSAALALAMATSLGTAHANVILSGPDGDDGSYSTAGLQSDATGGDTVSAGGLTGISLWGLLGGANASSSTAPVYGAITTSTPAGDNGKNAILRYYVLATSASGAQSVVSLGEIDPFFGGTGATPVYVAYQNTGGSLLTAPQLIVPGQAGRDLANVTSLQLIGVPAITGPGGQTTSLTLSGPVANPGTYTKTTLQNNFTPVQETVGGDTYTGVPLWTFLDPTPSSITSKIVITAGSDGYEVVEALAEIDPALGGNPADFLPYADTGTNFPTDGVARTIFPTDNHAGRWESNLAFVEVEQVPEPGTMSMFLAGLLSLGLVGWTRRGSQDG